MTKVFNISLQRTGTQSIHNFLLNAGIKSMHWIGHYGIDQYYPFKDKNDLIEKISILDDKFDAFNDMPYNILYDHYSIKYPDAKFIFITRDFDSWHNSIENFYKYELLQKQKVGKVGMTNFQKICYSEYIDINFDSQLFLSKEQYYEYYSKHYSSIDSYFKNSKNFLKIPLLDKDISQKILEFLNIDSNIQLSNIDFLKQFTKVSQNE